jgi:hypothetical protein
MDDDYGKVQRAEGAAGVPRGADEAADAGSGLRELPAGIRGLTGLQTLILRGCSGLRELPAGIRGLTGLQTLNRRSGCGEGRVCWARW